MKSKLLFFLLLINSFSLFTTTLRAMGRKTSAQTIVKLEQTTHRLERAILGINVQRLLEANKKAKSPFGKIHKKRSICCDSCVLW